MLSSFLANIDHEIAGWFRHHVTHDAKDLLLVVSTAGSAACVGTVLFLALLFFAWKRHWNRLVALLLTVPGGLLLNLAIKAIVARHRPFRNGPVHHWDSYSFPSGHTMGATVLYGTLLIAFIPLLKQMRSRVLAVVSAVGLVIIVGFSRIALTAHYLTDVIGAIVLGLIWLTLCVGAVQLLERRHRVLGPSRLSIF